MPDDNEPNAARSYGMSAAAVNVKLPELDAAKQSIAGMRGELKGLEDALRDFSARSYMIGNGINSMMKSIGQQADQTRQSLSGLSASLGGIGGGTGGGGGNLQSNFNSGSRPGGLGVQSMLGSLNVKDLLMAPINFLTSRINTNREVALAGGLTMGMMGRQQGANMGSVMSTMAKFPGSIYGGPQELMNMFGAAPSLGASYGFGGVVGGHGVTGGLPIGQGVRAQGFFKGIQQAQLLNPGASVNDLVNTIGGQAANTQSQQTSAFLTGGAFSMIKAGGRQKSLSEWAESILRWLETMRGGNKRGKPFNYGELMSQYFPGSNIDAWFTANGISPGMKEYFWTYALAKTKGTGTTQGGEFQITPDTSNLAQNRLMSTTPLTRTEFSLAGTMNGAYGNKEQANQWFNNLLGQIQTMLIPLIAKSPIGSFVQNLPDTIQEMFQGLAGAGAGLVSQFVKGGSGTGDVGDSGGYGEFGGTGTAGLHPDMKRKVGAMMRANPAISVTSGLRDTAMQKRLKGKGYSRVSGGPSAHTRGMAADLGPASQYGWIAANARKFGLKSGNSQGEPWHVGMGDIGDNPFGTELEPMISWLKNIAGDPVKFAASITDLLRQITGPFQSWLSDKGTGSLDYNPNLYAQMTGAATRIGLSSPKKGGGGIAGSTSASGGMGISKYSATRTPPDQLDDFTSSDSSIRGIAVAKAFYAAGFRGQDLKNMVAIALRESNWYPGAANNMGADRSMGLVQINKKPFLDAGMTVPFSDQDAFDPYGNAAIAWDMFNGQLAGGGTKGGYGPWTVPGGSWSTKLQLGPNDAPSQAVSQAGLGDVNEVAYRTMLPAPSIASRGIIFNNVFTINSSPGAGGGGLDVRRTVSLMADQLETEMHRRISRSN